MATARIDHLLGKIIVYLCYLLTGAISIEAQNPYFALVVGTALWLFGINGAAVVNCEIDLGAKPIHGQPANKLLCQVGGD